MLSSEEGGVGGVVIVEKEKKENKNELHKICGICCNELNALASGNRLRCGKESLFFSFIHSK